MTELRVAGSDTREALATRTVRASTRAAMLAAGPGWAAAFASAGAWEAHLDLRGSAVWSVPLMLVLGVGAALASWRAASVRDRLVVPPVTALLCVAAFGALVAARGDERLAALSLPLVPLVAGATVAAAAFVATRACVAGVRSAASGVVVGNALLGIVPGVHVLLVGAGSGIARATGWTAAYLTMAAIALARAQRLLPADRRRIATRERIRLEPATQASHALTVREVTVRFGSNVVLNGASMTVEPGHLIALCGANGAGKSTVLRAAAGFVPIETGQVIVGGEDVTGLLPEERAAAGLAFVSGARPVFPEMTVLQNLRVAAYRTHVTPRAFQQATDALFELIPTLARRRAHRAGVLSGGEQRLLAVAQTLYRKPAVLFADELTLGLDFDARLAVMDLLKVLTGEGMAVVAVDHDLPELLPRASRAALLVDGQIEMYDEPGALLERRADLLPATFLAGVDR